MNKKILLALYFIFILIVSCKKEKEDNDDPVTSAEVLDDFANILAKPNYSDIQEKAGLLMTAIDSLHTNTNSINLINAQIAWRAVRVPWEQAEGYLFGPAEDNSYDPATDTWPVNTTELDSLLASSNALTLADIEVLQYSLKGYHPIEYVLFGVGGSRVAAELTVRHLQYVVSLSQSLFNATSALVTEWDSFSVQLATAGSGSTRYATQKNAFLTIVGAMQKICNEVANNKMQKPLDHLDSSLVESQYAHNATTDFTNNIVGIENAYFGRYNSVYGRSIHNLVADKKSSLDHDIKAQITSTIASLDAIDPNYGYAIFNQQGQILTAQQNINALFDLLRQLENFIHANITN